MPRSSPPLRQDEVEYELRWFEDVDWVPYFNRFTSQSTARLYIHGNSFKLGDETYVGRMADVVRSSIVPMRMLLQLDLAEWPYLLDLILPQLARICNRVALSHGDAMDDEIIRKVASAFLPGKLQSVDLDFARQKMPHVERGIGEHVLKRHGGNGLLDLKIECDRCGLFFVHDFVRYFKYLVTLRVLEFHLPLGTSEYVEFCRALGESPCAQSLELLDIAHGRGRASKDDETGSSGAKMSALVSLLPKLKGLRRLNVDCNFPQNYNVDLCRTFFDALLMLPVYELDWSSNFCREHQVEALLDFIAASGTIEKLHLAYIDFTTTDCMSLSQAFGRSVSLREVVGWHCEDSQLSAKSLRVNQDLEYRGKYLGFNDIAKAMRIRSLPSARAIVVILCEAGQGCEVRGTFLAAGIRKQRKSLLHLLNGDLIRYLYSFFEQVSNDNVVVEEERLRLERVDEAEEEHDEVDD